MLRFLEERKVLLVYLPFAVYWLILFAATSFPVDTIPTVGVGDKFLHLTAYFGFGVLLNLTLVFQNKYNSLKINSAISTLIIGCIYGAFDEIHQHFIPGRSMEFLDFVADFAGLVLSIVFVILLMKLNDFVPGETKA